MRTTTVCVVYLKPRPNLTTASFVVGAVGVTRAAGGRGGAGGAGGDGGGTGRGRSGGAAGGGGGGIGCGGTGVVSGAGNAGHASGGAGGFTGRGRGRGALQAPALPLKPLLVLNSASYGRLVAAFEALPPPPLPIVASGCHAMSCPRETLSYLFMPLLTAALGAYQEPAPRKIATDCIGVPLFEWLARAYALDLASRDASAALVRFNALIIPNSGPSRLKYLSEPMQKALLFPGPATASSLLADLWDELPGGTVITPRRSLLNQLQIPGSAISPCVYCVLHVACEVAKAPQHADSWLTAAWDAEHSPLDVLIQAFGLPWPRRWTGGVSCGLGADAARRDQGMELCTCMQLRGGSSTGSCACGAVVHGRRVGPTRDTGSDVSVASALQAHRSAVSAPLALEARPVRTRKPSKRTRDAQDASADTPTPMRARVLPLRNGGSLHPIAADEVRLGMAVHALWGAPGNPHHYPAEVEAVTGTAPALHVDVRYVDGGELEVGLPLHHVLRYEPP